jgi:hypothetical protein
MSGTQSDGQPDYLTSDSWTPSTWQAGQPATPQHIDLSHLPMPTQDQIEQQRQTINARLKQYGYNPQQLSDQDVLSTMAPLPQKAVQWPDWVNDYFQRHPEDNVGPRLGIDRPTNQTYEEWNLKNHGMSGPIPTQVGASYGIPRGALIERYGQQAVDASDAANIISHSTIGANVLPVTRENGVERVLPSPAGLPAATNAAPQIATPQAGTAAGPTASAGPPNAQALQYLLAQRNNPINPFAQYLTPQGGQPSNALSPWWSGLLA